jgi:hypothetical protein
MTGVELGMTVHQNKFLAQGDTAMHAVLTVSARGGADTPPTRSAEVLMIDCSSSMRHPHTKIEEAKRAAAAAIAALPDGALFGVVRGAEDARVVYPEHDGLVVASDATRRAAQQAVARLGAYGGTAMGTWLAKTRLLFAAHPDTVRHAILLTDGNNESESHQALVAELNACEGQFVCDARGVGEGWDPRELAEIVKVLRGEADSVVEDHLLAADFRRLVEQALTKVLPGVRLRIGTMPYSGVRFVTQVMPNEYDLTDRMRREGDDEHVLSLGSWSADESKDYHLCLDLDPDAPASYDVDRQLAWAELEADGTVSGTVAVVGRWTHDPVQPTIVHPVVSQYLAQAELNAAMADGGDAYGEGRFDAAERAWGKAVRLATEQHNDGYLERLARIVEIRNAQTGDVRLRPDVTRSAIGSVLIAPSGIGGPRWPAADPVVAAGPPRPCPHCQEPNRPTVRFCESCGGPMAEVAT